MVSPVVAQHGRLGLERVAVEEVAVVEEGEVHLEGGEQVLVVVVVVEPAPPPATMVTARTNKEKKIDTREQCRE